VNLSESITKRWAASQTLCDLIPYGRVFTGRIPSTEIKRFPYMRIVTANASSGIRTNKAQFPRVTVGFHCWLDPTDLARGQMIQNAVADFFANTCWQLDSGYFVRDVLDLGPPIEHQIDTPGIRAWEVAKIFTFVLERRRVDTGSCCAVSGD